MIGVLIVARLPANLACVWTIVDAKPPQLPRSRHIRVLNWTQTRWGPIRPVGVNCVMTALYDVARGVLRPLFFALLLIMGLGLMADDPSRGVTGVNGFACKGITSSAELNRALCRIHPKRIWNMPVTDVIPYLRGEVTSWFAVPAPAKAEQA